jgi:thioredoxin reductase (NADPH)
MELPVCVVVDDDPDTLNDLPRDLKRRYGEEYAIVSAPNGLAGLQVLERLRGEGRPVALIIAALQLPDTAGFDFLCRARDLHPLARRIALIDSQDFFSNETLNQAMTLGQADCWLTKPWAPPDQLLYPAVSELLGEWQDDAEHRPSFIAQVVGDQWTPQSHQCREVLDRNNIPYRFRPADSAEGRQVLRQSDVEQGKLPVVILADGRVLVRPTNADVVGALGILTRPSADRYDVVVVGAGPAGLSAAVYAASEGLRTLLVEREAFGGQAGTSARIRNYLGFPRGISGRRLAQCARQQAALFGAEMVYGQASGLQPEGADRVVLLREGGRAVAGAVVLATGVTYRRLGIRSVERFVGAGVFYGSAVSEARDLRGEEVLVVGGGNSAGQAAAHLSRFASQVTLVVRGDDLAASMSDYLRRELESLGNVAVRLRTQVVDAAGSGRLERVTLEDSGSGARTTVPAAALFILIGTMPRTEWLAGVLERDPGGFILTGRDIQRPDPANPDLPRAQERFRYESSLPGVFAAGDVRAASEKRVAAAVGEGSGVIRMIHEYLAGR